MMSSHSLHLYGEAILDYFNGNFQTPLIVVDELGRRKEVPVNLFFREFGEFPEMEKKAVELCSGKVLDIAAAAGRHSLALQQRGLIVCAVDIIPSCVQVMKMRGVHEAYCTDILEFQGGPFDTLLGVMNGLTIVERLERLPAFLKHIRRLIGPDGQYLVDSADLRCSVDSQMQGLLKTKTDAGDYFGELTAHIEYRNKKGTTLRELFVDPETLRDHAFEAGWKCDIVMQQNNGRYLAQLAPL